LEIPLDKERWCFEDYKELKRVKSLFGSGNNGWNHQLVHSIFLSHDANNILKMRATSQYLDDTRVCHYEKNGLFTVKSAYKLASNLNREAPAAASTEPNGRRGLWKNVWKANNRIR
jgi:hypothetical protein